MSDALMYEIMPGWLEENLDEESQALIEGLSSEVAAADFQVAEFEGIISKLAAENQEIPQAVMLRGMRDYQRSLVQRMRLNHQVTLAAQGLIFETLLDQREGED